MLSFFLGISSYSQADFFSFLRPCWQKPTNLFFGACSFVRNRLPIVTKAQLREGEEQSKREFSNSVTQFKDQMMQNNVTPLNNQARNLDQLARKLNEGLEKQKQQAEENYNQMNEKINDLDTPIQEINNQLAGIALLNKQALEQLKTDKEAAEKLLNDSKVESEKIERNMKSDFKKLHTRFETNGQAHLIKLEEINNKLQTNHQNFMILAKTKLDELD